MESIELRNNWLTTQALLTQMLEELTEIRKILSDEADEDEDEQEDEQNGTTIRQKPE